MLGVSNYALSLDGQRLYLTNLWEEISRDATEMSVWVIDTTTWNIVDRWQTNGTVSSIDPNWDTGTVAVQSQLVSLTGDRPRSLLTVFDESGLSDELMASDFPVPEWASDIWWTSPAVLYRQAYGRAPVVADAVPEDNTQFTTLPRMNLIPLGEVIPSGGDSLVFLRVLDPVTNRLFNSSNPETRFDPGATVTLVLSHPDADDVVVVPSQSEVSVYRSSVRLDALGWWEAEVIVRNPDGTTWSFSYGRTFEVIETFRATDGKDYMLRASLNPPEDPATTNEILIQAEFVEVESSNRMPEGVTLEGGLPESIDVTLNEMRSDDLFSIATATLHQVGHGVYEGQTGLRGFGTWQVTLRFEQSGGDTITVSSGRMSVMHPTIP